MNTPLNNQQFTEEDKPFLFSFPDGTAVYCNRPDKIHGENTMQGFFKVFGKYIDRKMIAIDIGASCGDSTVVMAHILKRHGGTKVIAFEPSIDIRELLIYNLSKNEADCDLHFVAAGNSDTEMDFAYHIDNGGLIIPQYVPERTRGHYKVNVVHTYNHLAKNYSIDEMNSIGFIKIDTEGYDFAVLNGLSELILRNKMPVMVEWWNGIGNSKLMFDEINKLNYQAFNSLDERVTHEDFNTPKRTQDLILLPK